MIYLSDYHIHTTFSDGKDIPERYVEVAIEAGIQEIGFSDHLTITSEQQPWAIDPSRLNEYSDYILNLKSRYPQIKIRLGLEVDYIPGIEEKIEALTNSLPLDYLMGSVHYMGERTVDFGPEFYSGKDLTRIWDDYFDLVMSASSSRLFDFIAHPDLVRIFKFLPSTDRKGYYIDLAETLKRNDTAFEVNCNGRNKPIGDFYPDRQYLDIFYKAGVPVCVNSDAHTPDRVGQYFTEAYRLVAEAGWSDMVKWKGRKRSAVPFTLPQR